MEVSFKIATLEDVDAIIELCNECFEENTDIEYAKKFSMKVHQTKIKFI